MTVHQALLLLLLLEFKHLWIDWIWQTQAEINNKGTYGHLKGICHSVKHAIGSMVCCFLFLPLSAFHILLLIFLIDFLIHYHVDWAKMYVMKMTNWVVKDPGYWWSMGIDQFLHHATYIMLVFFLTW